MKNLLKQASMVCLILTLSIGAAFAQGTVTGSVTDETGSPLIGATVIVKSTSAGTVTDADGNYSIKASSGDVLVFSFVGYLSSEIEVTSSTMDVSMEEDATTLSDLVVTATRQPVRKIQTTSAINTIGEEELRSIQPESIGEAIVSSPGLTVENSQGRKSFFNIRGFPSGNTYVTTLLDGLPLNGFASRSAGTAEYLGLDQSIERVEVVRGSGATLFGRAAAAGAVNMISRTGGEELAGSVSFTRFNNVVGDGHPFEGDFDYRADFHLSGPIGDKLRFGMGGYLMQDSGYKEWAIKDRGAQISANLEYLISEKSRIRVYGNFGNNQFNNLTDAPYDLGDRQIADGWSTRNTYYADNSQLDFESTLINSPFAPAAFQVPVLDANGKEVTQNQAEDNREEVAGGMIGLSADIALTDGLSLIQRIRATSYDWRDHNEITFSSFYTPESRILRLNANSIGKINDLINETRLQYRLEGENAKHLFSAGFYYSTASYDRFGGLHWYTANVSPTPTYGWFGPPGTPPPTGFSLSGTTSHQEESVTAFFIGDEMVFNEKLSINAGVRFDQMTGFFNNDPEVIGDIDFNPAELTENELDFSNWSGSLGINYLFSERSAVYGSIVRAFSLPSVGLNTPIPEKDEIVVNTELGVRFGIGDLGIDFGAFNTVIDNRVATVFDPTASTGQTFIPRPVGRNTVRGTELQLTYAPSNVNGLLFRGSFTLQDSRYDGFQIALRTIDDDRDPETPRVVEADIDNLFGLELITIDAASDAYAVDVTGNRVQNTPNFIASFNAGYTAKYFGVGFDFVHYAGRFATALNLYETPNLTIANANIFGRYPMSNGNAIRLGVRIKNLFDSANPQQLVLGSVNDNVLVQRQATPDFDGVLGFGIMQIPRRVLITLGYDF
ncbi:MAG: TonB-dependent receptor [Bacteroidota bacterium]